MHYTSTFFVFDFGSNKASLLAKGALSIALLIVDAVFEANGVGVCNLLSRIMSMAKYCVWTLLV